MIGLALLVGRAMTAGGEIGDLLRRAVVPRLHLVPGMRHKVMDSTAPPLRRPALAYRTHVGHQLAGTLCPNTITSEGQRVDASLGSDLAAWLHRGHVTAVIVRPDRTVLKAGRDLRALSQALRNPSL